MQKLSIMPTVWKAVCYLAKIEEHIIAETADGASRNFFLFFRMYELDSEEDVVYRAHNIHSKYSCYIYFFADVPHLIKIFHRLKRY